MAINLATRVAKFGAIAAVAVGLGVAGAAISSADVAPQAATVSVSPSSGLSDGQTVNVDGSGLDAGVVYTVGQCGAISETDFACNAADWKDIAADGNGNLSTPLVVRSNFTGTDSTGTSHDVDCKVTSCIVAVFDASFNGGTAPLSFS